MLPALTPTPGGPELSSPFLFFKKISLTYSCFTMLYYFLLCSKVSQPHVYICSLFLGFPSNLGHYRALSRVPCAIQQVLISYLLVSVVYTCQSQTSNSSHPSILPWYPYVGSLHLYLYFCFANRFTCTIFLDSTYIHNTQYLFFFF